MKGGLDHKTPEKPQPVISGIFVKCSIEQVIGLFRTSLNRFAQSMETTYFEVSGDDARIKHDFGPDQYIFKPCDWLENYFPVRGQYRLSTVAHNPNFTFVETYCRIAVPFLCDLIHEWTEADTYEFWSYEGENPLLDTPEIIQPQHAYPSNGFFSVQNNVVRFLHISKNGKRWNVVEKGPIAHFENQSYYAERLKADRLNRSILFEYMKKLDLDPDEIFIKRNLVNPVLFTGDHTGKVIDPNEAEIARDEQLG